MSTSFQKHDKQSLYFLLRSGLAGGIAGCVAKTVVAPLDRVKILFQASNPDYAKYAGTWTGVFRAGAEIYGERGVLGLFQGHSATLLRVFPYAAIKFMVYDQLEDMFIPKEQGHVPAFRFVAGALAGMSSVLVTYPLELVRVRMAYRTHSAAFRQTFLRALSEIYTEAPRTHHPSALSRLFAHPLFNFYRGFTVTIAGILPYAGTSFYTWETLRARFDDGDGDGDTEGGKRSKGRPLVDLGIGAVAGVASQTVSYPFEVVRRRMQVGGLTNPGKWLRWDETVRAVWRAGGWRGFYVGLSIGYLKIVPMTAVSFAVWQGAKRALGV